MDKKVHTSCRSLVSDDSADGTPQGVYIFSLNSDYLQSMSFKGLGQVVTLEIFRRMSRNGNVVVINEQLDIESLSDSKTGGFRVVAFLLRPV